jgi:serine/threonine protein kinase
MSEQSFGKYTLLKKIATGGMAEVWLARQSGIEGFQRNLVVKRILPHLADDPEFVQMFLNEARIAARFNHPNIAQIYDLGETNGTYYIAMEFIHGEDLGRLMRKAWSTGQWIARPLAIRIVAGACEGLYYAHTRTDEQGRPLKVVHRDISPQNILISFDGSVKLVDFGIAKAADQASMTKSGAIKGKFAYMAPEQAAGKVLDHRTDIFAIGLVLYELLTGVRPLKRDSEIATLQAALECAIDVPSTVADVPAELDPVVMKALTKASDDRYRDARQFQLALEEFLVSQRWVASSVQLSELMSTLFADRLEEEARLGHPDPGRSDSQVSLSSPKPAAETDPSARTAASKKGKAPEMSWEAPPGEVNAPKQRGMAKGNYRADPARSQAMEPPPDVPSWDAPAGEEIPVRRRSETGMNRRAVVSTTGVTNETAIARTQSRGGDLRRADPPGRRVTETRIAPLESLEDDRDERDNDRDRDRGRDDRDERDEREEAPPPPRRSNPAQKPAQRSGQHRKPAAAREPEPEPEDYAPPREERVEEEDEQRAAPPRRRSAPAPERAEKPVRKTSPKHEAQPRPSVVEESLPPARPRQLDPEVAKRVAALSLRGQQKRQIWVLYACLGLVGLVTLFVFKQPIVDTLSRSESSAQEVKLRIVTNAKVRVVVRHHKDEGGMEEELSPQAGVDLIRGAHLRDTVILESKSQGIHYEHELDMGQPGEIREIKKEFQTGFARLDTLGSRSLEGMTLYEYDQPRFVFQPGQKLELYEGKHTLELRDKDGQRVGRPFELNIRAGVTLPVREDILKGTATAGKGSP